MSEEREEYLEADKEIPGQKYVCLSFLSPENVLANKDIYFFNAFLNDYEVQYKINSTEKFLMQEMRRVTDALSKSEDILSNLRSRSEAEPITYADISGVVDIFKNVRQNLTRETGNALENHVKENMRDFKETTIQENFETFMFKNRKRLEDEFFAKNNFRTTMRTDCPQEVLTTLTHAWPRLFETQKLAPWNRLAAPMSTWMKSWAKG